MFSLWAGHQPGKHVGFASVTQNSVACVGWFRKKKIAKTNKMGEVVFARVELFHGGKSRGEADSRPLRIGG